MQNKTLKEKYVLLSVPAAMLSEAGIRERDILEIYADGGKLVMQAADTEGFICNGECESCPMSEVDCDDNCESCPCYRECEDAEVMK